MTAAHVPTDITKKVVENLSGTLGLTNVKVAKVMGINEKTLVKYYGDILSVSSAYKNLDVANGLYHNAVVEGNVTAQIFWLKTRARWSEASPEVDDDQTIKKIEIEVIPSTRNK